MNPNSGHFLSQKWAFIGFAIMTFILDSFVPLVLTEEQTDTSKAGVPVKTAEGGEHPVSIGTIDHADIRGLVTA